MSDIGMSVVFKSEFVTDGATVYNLKDSMWLGKPSKSNEWCFGVQNTDATDSEREDVAKFIAHAINTHDAMQARINELVFSLDDRDCYIADADMKNSELQARIVELEKALTNIKKHQEATIFKMPELSTPWQIASRALSK